MKMDNINKSILRDRIKKLRAGMALQEKQEKDRLLYNNIISSGVLDNVRQVYIFVSYGTEVDTKAVIEMLLRAQCYEVCVPRVHGSEMEFYRINDLSDLTSGYNGILEPVCGNPVLHCNGIMFLPGLVFDIYHGRAGYGGGFYDRYLYRHREDNIYKIGLAYDFQVLKEEKIDMEAHDVRPDIIITEKAVY